MCKARWRGESAANSSRKCQIPWASGAPRTQRKRALNQFLTSQFPTHPNREFFAALQGIKSGDQGKFRLDQGIPLSSAVWAFALPTIRSSRQISNLAEEANREAARCSKSPKPISSPALSVPRRAANRSPSASTRTIGRSGLHDGGAGPSHAPECTELTVEGDRGFESIPLQRGVCCEPRSRRSASGVARCLVSELDF